VVCHDRGNKQGELVPEDQRESSAGTGAVICTYLLIILIFYGVIVGSFIVEIY
jgi:hypothetical protein